MSEARAGRAAGESAAPSMSVTARRIQRPEDAARRRAAARGKTAAMRTLLFISEPLLTGSNSAALAPPAPLTNEWPRKVQGDGGIGDLFCRTEREPHGNRPVPRTFRAVQ